MRYLFIFVFILFLHPSSNAKPFATDNQHSVSAIQEVLRNYIEGTSYNRRQQIAKAFNPAADLLLEKEGQAFAKVSVTEYLNWYKPENQGKFNGRNGDLLSSIIRSSLNVVAQNFLNC